MLTINKKQLEINKRQIEIINFLAGREKHITIENISKMFDRSQRTIRNDLDSIEYVLNEHNMSLERKPGVGVRFNSGQGRIENILSMYEHKIYSAEERALFALIIIMTEEKTTFEEIAKQLHVSKNTIIQDIKSAESMLEEHHIRINKKAYYGIFLDGDEDQIRSYLLQLYKRSEKYIQIDINKHLIKYLPENMNKSMTLIELVEEIADVTYSEEALNELELMINFSFCRVSIGNTIKYSNDYIEQKKCEKNYKILEECINNLKYKITESETCYLLKLFSGAKSTLGNFITTNTEIDQLAADIIKDMCDVININPNEDLEFKEQMSLHLKVAIFRLKNNLIICNPLLEEIKYKIAFIYNITENILSEYEGALDVEFPESEIAYIAMYFAALFERNVKQSLTYRVLLICNCGLATSGLLKTRVKEMIPEIKIIAICRLRDIEMSIEKYEFDFLISTVPLTLDGHKVIQVNPLLGLNDIEEIKGEIFRRTYENNCKTLAKKVQDKDEDGITQLLSRKYSQIGLEIEGWRQAIGIAAEPLIADKKIKRQYVSEIIKVIENIGNYMVFISEIAFVHAEPDLVMENSVSILVLKKPIKFGSKKETLVKVIIVLANKDENMNLINLVNILTKEGNIQKLKDATCYEDIENIK